MNRHALIREQIIQWLLGEATDTSITALADHLCACRACREYARRVEETFGRLPEALALEHPAPTVREAVLAAIRQPAAGSIEHRGLSSEVTDEGEPGRAAPGAERWRLRLRGWARELYTVTRGPVAAILLIGTLALNGMLVGSWAVQRGALKELSARYEAETRWLASAEQILVEGHLPLLRTELAATEIGSSASGQAVVYHAYGDTHYLLLQVTGLEADTLYEVWLQSGSERMQLGSIRTSADGAERWVYRSENGLVAGRLGVRREGASGPALVAEL